MDLNGELATCVGVVGRGNRADPGVARKDGHVAGYGESSERMDGGAGCQGAAGHARVVVLYTLPLRESFQSHSLLQKDSEGNPEGIDSVLPTGKSISSRRRQALRLTYLKFKCSKMFPSRPRDAQPNTTAPVVAYFPKAIFRSRAQISSW